MSYFGEFQKIESIEAKSGGRSIILPREVKAFGRLFEELSFYQNTPSKDQHYLKVAKLIVYNQKDLFQELQCNPEMDPLVIKVSKKLMDDSCASDCKLIKDVVSVIDGLREEVKVDKERDSICNAFKHKTTFSLFLGELVAFKNTPAEEKRYIKITQGIVSNKMNLFEGMISQPKIEALLIDVSVKLAIESVKDSGFELVKPALHVIDKLRNAVKYVKEGDMFQSQLIAFTTQLASDPDVDTINRVMQSLNDKIVWLHQAKTSVDIDYFFGIEKLNAQLIVMLEALEKNKQAASLKIDESVNKLIDLIYKMIIQNDSRYPDRYTGRLPSFPGRVYSMSGPIFTSKAGIAYAIKF